jgi:hypothetical protein
MKVDIREIEVALADLPPEYEPLLLTFYRPPLQVSDHRVVIGNDGDAELHVELDSGHVLSVAAHGGPTRFVNSSIARLRASIDAYVRYADRVTGVNDDADARHLVEQLRRAIANIDNAATENPEAWWSVILEQADDGLV